MDPDPRLLTRRRLLKGAGGAAGIAMLGGAAFGATRAFTGSRRIPKLPSFRSHNHGPVREFVSRPDLRPPTVTVTGTRVAPGHFFLGPGANRGAQAGPLLVDGQGDPVWFQPIPRALWLTNFRLAHYQGQPVLTWWEGRVTERGFGRGEGVVVDSSYRELARVRAGNGHQIDMHEFMVTPRGTALFVCYPETVPADLSPIGGPIDGTALQSIVQEVEVKSGRVLLEWRSLDHVAIDESYQRPALPYDYLHANSVAVAPDGNLLVSARCTWALYKLERQTGRLLWRLGGKRTDFKLSKGARFSWQHDASQPTASTIALFDDGDAAWDDGSGTSNTESQSRGVVLDVDEKGRSVRLARSYRHPHPLLANAMGSCQILPDAHVVVGWGSDAVASEFSAGGQLLADVRLGSNHGSYRAYCYPWAARPSDRPAIAIRPSAATDETTLYASWNGATAVSHWLVWAGPRPSQLEPVGLARRRGFETAIPMRTKERFIEATALDVTGRPLGTSGPVSR